SFPRPIRRLPFSILTLLVAISVTFPIKPHCHRSPGMNTALVLETSDCCLNSSLPIDCHSTSCSSENGVSEEQNNQEEEQEPCSHSAQMAQEVVYSLEFAADASPDAFLPTLGDICSQSGVPRCAQLCPSRESTHTFFVLIEKDESSMSWQGLNSLVSVARVEYRDIESLLDRKNIISIFDLPNFGMCGGSEVLAALEKDIQNLSVAESKENSDAPAKADPATIKRAVIVILIKDELKTESEEGMRALAEDACFDTNARDVQAVIDPATDDHFFLLFVRPSHILDNIALMRRGLLENKVTIRKVAESTPVVQDRFLELVADGSRCFPVDVKKKLKEDAKAARGSVTPRVAGGGVSQTIKSMIATNGLATPSPRSEPGTPPSGDALRSSRGPTSGHIARRLVEGSLGIRSTVTREQVKKENQLVASFAAEKRATRQKQQAVANQVKEAFE
ncbi:hypothetical protein PMAYCL1PPCAC_33295, partial [Pristionchus mayeri]